LEASNDRFAGLWLANKELPSADRYNQKLGNTGFDSWFRRNQNETLFGCDDLFAGQFSVVIEKNTSFPGFETMSLNSLPRSDKQSSIHLK